MVSVLPSRPASYPLLLAIYVAYLIGGIAMYYLIVYLAETYLQKTVPVSSSMGVVLVMIAAVSTGSAWFNREQAAPSSGRKWVMAAIATLITLILQFAVLAMLLSSEGGLRDIARKLAGEDRLVVAGLLGGALAFALLVIRSGLWLGVRNATKVQAKTLARAGR